MKKTSIFIALLLALFIQGCAQKNAPTMLDEDKERFKSGHVATSYYMLHKTVNYSEVLYRVLWVENRSSSMDFSGIWKPDNELSVLVNKQLTKRGINATEISDFIDKNKLNEYYYSQISTDFEPYISGVNSTTPVTEYLNKYPNYSGFEKVRITLLKNNIRYYFEVLSSGTYGNAIGFGTVIAGSTAFMRIIDLEKKKVVWVAVPLANKFHQIGGDLNKLEENNLALLKESVRLGLSGAIELLLKDMVVQ